MAFYLGWGATGKTGIVLYSSISRFSQILSLAKPVATLS